MVCCKPCSAGSPCVRTPADPRAQIAVWLPAGWKLPSGREASPLPSGTRAAAQWQSSSFSCQHQNLSASSATLQHSLPQFPHCRQPIPPHGLTSPTSCTLLGGVNLHLSSLACLLASGPGVHHQMLPLPVGPWWLPRLSRAVTPTWQQAPQEGSNPPPRPNIKAHHTPPNPNS